MRQLRLEVGDRVYVKGRENEGLWEVYDEERDREGNYCYHIHQEDETGCSDESGIYAEALIPEDEYGYGPETCRDCQDELTECEQAVYDLLEFRERLYKLVPSDDIDDKLLEVTNSIALELGVDVEKIINWNRKAGI